MDEYNSNTGYGLQNMRARARETGMTLTIHSEPSMGTELVIESDTTN
jgi:signal transduction histidine kinase